MFSIQALTAQIRAMGIASTDTVLIHTSMRAIGEVENGADGVIDAFKAVLSDGLLLVPTHTWRDVKRERPVYDVRSTVPCLGALPRAAAFRTDGVRSLHPTHSIWATGRGAAEYVAGEEKALTPGAPGFAWARLAEVGAKILLLGVRNDCNTFIHAVEELAGTPDRLSAEPYEITIIDRDGNEHRHPYYTHYCSRTEVVSEQYLNFEAPLQRLGAMTLGKLGNAEVRIVDAQKCRDVILKIYARADRDLCLERMEIPEALYL